MVLMALLALSMAFIPGFAWLAFYLREDTHPEPKRLIAFTFTVGMAFGLFTVGVERFFTITTGRFGVVELSLLSLIGLALIEEVMKYAAAHFSVKNNPAFREPVDAMIYMIVAALGFATLENIGAVSNLISSVASIPAILEVISFRFVGATLLHALTSGVVGYYWALGIRAQHPLRHIPSGLSLAALLHVFFNYLILNYDNAGVAILFLFIVGFFVLNDFEKLRVSPAKS